jgi:protein-S-isoprenylcysteine O-methyltransferase Ste14
MVGFISSIVSVIFVIGFFISQRLLREGEEARSFEKKSSDKNSTLLVATGTATVFTALLGSIVLNYFRIATINLWLLTLIGIIVMTTGLTIRIIAQKTLSKYYTATLKTIEKQTLVTDGIYKCIRHPGYGGTILLISGAGITSNNYITLMICIIIPLLVYPYRIRVEEKMLLSAFGHEYVEYSKKTKRIIPFVF